MSNHDPIRAALIGLREAVEGIELEGVPEVDQALAAALAALAASTTVDEPAVPQEGGEPATVAPDSGTAAMRRLVEGPIDERGYVDLRQPEAPEDRSQLSDGFHTFAELYEHRHSLMLALMRALPGLCWFSERHSDGELPFGSADWFIVGANLPTGAITYHLPISILDLAAKTGAAKLERGIIWDGHTADDVIQRLRAWATAPAPVKGGMEKLVADMHEQADYAYCEFISSDDLHRAATLLQSQATELAALRSKAAPVPVPVGERLPGPEDCDAKGRCWWFGPINGEDISHSYWALINGKCDNDTHWLPHWAMSHPCHGGEVEQ